MTQEKKTTGILDPKSLDVTVYLHIDPAPEAFRCEIVAGSASDTQTFYDAARHVLITSDLRELKRYTLVAARSAKRRGKAMEQRALARLAEWIAAVLRELTGAERAAIIALAQVPGSKGLHWLIAPLEEGTASAVDASVLGMEQGVLVLKDSAVDRLAGRLHQALA